jgi:hypothetical protein
MSDSNRGVLATFAGIAALLVATGAGAFYGSLYSPAKKQYAAVSTSQGTSEAYQGVTESLPDIALIPDSVERAIANPTPQSGQDHEKRDLAAQESMAVWAFYMALFAGMTALITGVGTYFIAAQVKLTREAVEDTRRATGAMERQNNLMQATQRAWVIIEPEILYLNVKDRGIVGVSCAVHFRNNGQTVARDVAFTAVVGTQNSGDLDEVAQRMFERAAERAKCGKGTIMPTERLTFKQGAFGGLFNPTPKVSQYVMIWAHVCYRIEGCDEPRHTMRSFALGIPSDNGGVFPMPITDKHAGIVKLEDLQLAQFGQSLTS